MNIRHQDQTKPALTRQTFQASLIALAVAGALHAMLPQQAMAQAAGAVLSAGTVPILRGVVSGSAVINAPVTTATGSLLTIDQQSQRAIIDWNQFNIAKGSEVRFNQPNATASALNRIYSLDPSIIQGKLSATGQVILINQNGILFDRGAEVGNINSFIASTLNISNARFNSGVTSGGMSSTAFEGRYDDAGNTVTGGPTSASIEVGRYGNATVAAPTLQALAGGSIVLIAPNINHQTGLITAPDGQVILAAGSKVWLAVADDTNLPPSNATVRGMRVEIEADASQPVNVTSLINNTGDISADRGNVTLAALAINQSGRVSASTAVQSEGSIWLQARSKDDAQRGSIVFGAGSVTQTLPDLADTGRMTEGQSYNGGLNADGSAGIDHRALIQIEGKSIINRGTITAPGGVVAITATDGINGTDQDSARVYLDQGSSISVAGTWADIDYLSNLLTFKVTSNELKDAVDQKTGLLKGSTVTVDLRKGSPLLDLSAYVSAQKRSVAEKTAVGGDLSIKSAGSVIQRQGATLDASGGGYKYGAGTDATSKLLGDDGQIYDISTAPENKRYTQILDRFEKHYDRWGQTVVFDNLLYGYGQHEDAYVEGKAGGSISVLAHSGLVLDGTLKGGSTSGPTQLAQATPGASLTIGLSDSAIFKIANGNYQQQIGSLTFVQQASDTLGAFDEGSALSSDQMNNWVIGADQLAQPMTSVGVNTVQQNGFESVEITSQGSINLPASVSYNGAAGSSLTLRAPQTNLNGTINVPAGKVVVQTTTTALTSELLTPEANRAFVNAGATIATTGLWINTASADGSYIGLALPSAKRSIDGQSTTSLIKAGGISFSGPATFSAGSVLDVSGGASIDKSKKLTAGDGGAISLALDSVDLSQPAVLGSTLRGFGLNNGGSLTVNAPVVVLGALSTATSTTPSTPALFATAQLDPSLFDKGGFSNITIKAQGGLTVSENTQIVPRQDSFVIDPLQAPLLASGGKLSDIVQVATLPDYQRKPVNLTLASKDQIDLQKGALIAMDPNAKLNLSAIYLLNIDGQIKAPAGAVTLSVDTASGDDLSINALLHLGADSLISAAGTTVLKPSDTGLRVGTVFGAGSITLDTKNAIINAEAGSTLDVGGTSQVLDVLSDSGSPILSKTYNGDAGTILVRAQDAVHLDGKLVGKAASADSAGGSFALEFANRAGSPTVLPDRRIVVTQAATTAVPDSSFVDAPINIDALSAGGFQKLRLQTENSIEFRGDVAMNFVRGIKLDAPLINLANLPAAPSVSSPAQVNLSGAEVVIGQSQSPRILNTTYDLTSQQPSLILPTRAGTGQFTVHADTIDLYGDVTLDGVAQSSFIGNHDIRLTGRASIDTSAATTMNGSLTSTGNIVLQAAQIYPTTLSNYTFAVKDQPGNTLVDGGRIDIAGNGNTPGDVYSVGGSLTLQADHIVQGGVVKAPLGTVNFEAGKTLTLTGGSTTSVSADGLTIPYGSTIANVDWQYLGGISTDRPTGIGKTIKLSGPSIDLQAGSTVDLSGGGDVQLLEFVPGSGGSNDVLLKDNTYAIIPASKLSSMPIDSDIAARKDLGFGFATVNQDKALYDSIHIGAGAAVPEGDYVLLSGRYALLPGAYLVQVQSGNYSNLQDGKTVALANGQSVIPAYRTVAGTNIRQSQTIGVIVRPGSEAKKESDYNINGASFFGTQALQQGNDAPPLPVDGGHLIVSNANTLNLNGRFITQPATADARSAEVDISANQIAVVDQIGQASIDPAYLQIAASDLSAFDGSILIGGTRVDSGKTTQIATTASDVLVANSAAHALESPEVLLAAFNTLTVQSGSVLSGNSAGNSAGSGSVLAQARDISIDASGALIRVANSAQVKVDRGTTPLPPGDISIELGATLKAKSILLDATGGTHFEGDLLVDQGGALSLASGKVSLGDTASVSGINDGLVLSNSTLTGLNQLGQLTIKGYNGIDLYGSTTLGNSHLKDMVLDAAAIRGNDLVAATSPSTSSISAQQLTLRNSSADATTSVGTGSLVISADHIILDKGDKNISGFSQVAMNTPGEIVASGTGSLNVASDWSMQAARISGTSGANQNLRAADLSIPASPVYYNLSINGASAPAILNDSTVLGARLNFEGQRVDVATAIVAKSGVVTLTAKGLDASDDVHLLSGAVIDAGGAYKDFNGAAAIANAGTINLASTTGNVRVDGAASLNVAAVTQGGSAGTINVSAAQTAQLDGVMNGSANADQTQGQFTLDSGTLADFSALNAKLNAGGFTERRDMRVRSGDLTVAGSDLVKAHHIQLTADAGRIAIDGKLDASAPQGKGSIDLYAQTGLSLGAGSVLDASGTSTAAGDADAYANGGSVHLSTRSGLLSFDSSAVIDVRAGAKGQAGNVTFSIARDSSNAIATTPDLQGTVLSQRHASDAAGAVVLEANRVYDVSGLTSADIAGNLASMAFDHADFVGNADVAALTGSIKGDDGLAQGNRHVRGATELTATGDVELPAWNLTNADWLTLAEPGTLTVRAAGNLTISKALGFVNDNLVAGKTWNIRLVGGADLSAANAMATQSLDSLVAANTGDVLFDGATAKLRTGTGNIEVAAGRDFKIDNIKSVIYTAGIAGEPDIESPSAPRWAVGGGNISIAAGRDAKGLSSEWITEWLRRPRVNQTTFNLFNRADWWVYRPNFQDAIGAMAGGDVAIKAGHDVDKLSAFIPSSGRTYRDVDGTRKVDIQNGGDLSVEAGNDIIAGNYLVSRGTGQLKAGGSVGSADGVAAPTQLYLMGESIDLALKAATINVEAGQDIVLRSIDNPTALLESQSRALSPTGGPATATGPSFSGTTGLATTFFTYTENSSVHLTAKGGDVVLGGAPDVAVQYVAPASVTNATATYPASVDVIAFDGNISGDGTQLALYPSLNGSLRLLAGDSVKKINVVASDAVASKINTINNPVAASARRLTGDALITSPAVPKRVDHLTPDTYVYDIQALSGSILDTKLSLPAVSRLWAAEDIALGVGGSLQLQNLQANDVSVVHADKGDVTPGNGIEIRGPGRLLLQAGGNIDAGQAAINPSGGPSSLGGIVATGNTTNSSLPTSDSARLTLIAGVSGQVDLNALDASYDELIAAGKANDKARADAAIAKVFARAVIGHGNINSYQTSIQTYGGSDIDLWAPGGNIVVGLTTPDASKSIGLITNSGGAIRSYLSGDFNINQGKVLTAQGGDILIYTRDGSIDAGRGAKTSLSTPPPKKTPVFLQASDSTVPQDSEGNALDADGNKIVQAYLYTVPASAAGSGIQTLTSDPDGPGPRVQPLAGSIYLFAPSGTIDAGEAGIVSGANLFIAAQTILNASNISASGTSVGVPQVEAGSLASSLASSGANTTGNSKSGDEAAQAAAKAARDAAADAFKPSILTVEVVGFGEKNCKESDKDCLVK